jgi:hypothetical protein
MAIQLRETEVQNVRLDAIDTAIGASGSLRIYTGAQPALPTSVNSGTLLAHILLPNPAFAAAATGTMAKSGTWSDASADGGSASTPGHFRFYNSQATMDGTTCVMQGDCAIGSGIINFNGTITAGQTVTISTMVLTEGND